MKIQRRNSNYVPFSSINKGDVFEYEDSLYMKLWDATVNNTGKKLNSVLLNRCYPVFFAPTCYVNKTNGTFVEDN